MRQGAYLIVSFEPQWIKSPNLAIWQIQARAIIFRNLLNNLEDWAKFHVLFNLATGSNYSITNDVKIPLFHIFVVEKLNKEHLKNGKCQLLK